MVGGRSFCLVIHSIRGKFCRMIDCQAVRSIFNSAAWEIKVAVTLELCGAKVIDCTLGFFRIIHTRQNDTQQSLIVSLSYYKILLQAHLYYRHTPKCSYLQFYTIRSSAPFWRKKNHKGFQSYKVRVVHFLIPN